MREGWSWVKIMAMKGSSGRMRRQAWRSGAALLLVCLMESLLVVAGGAMRGDRYRIDLDLDYPRGTYTGRQTFEWTNRGGGSVDYLEFSLYPNVGATVGSGIGSNSVAGGSSPVGENGFTVLEVLEVTAPGRQIKTSIRLKRTVLRVDFDERIENGQRVVLHFRFKGAIPRVQREETSLLAHFMQEVNDALEEERVPVDARDVFFAGEEAILLGYFHPLLIVRPQNLGEVRFPVGLSRLVLTGVADYEVAVEIRGGPADLDLFSSGRAVRSGMSEGRSRIYHFAGEARRGFAIAIAEKLRRLEGQYGRTKVVSWHRDPDGRQGQRVLEMVGEALLVYRDLFGEYPYETLHVVEFPVTAGYSAIDLPGMIVLPQAYYVDLNAARLPGVIREQADVIRASFELNVSQAVARQWWGRVVGIDGERAPLVAESLSLFAALHYHERRYGAALAESIIRQYVRGAYQAHRILGGLDMEADKPLRDFSNGLEYAAIVQAKGALMLFALREQLGAEQFHSILRDVYRQHAAGMLTGEGFRQSLLARSGDSRPVRMLLQRWLKERRGDEDIGTPELAQDPGPVSKFRSLGRIFLKIGVKIGKRAARPF